MTPLKKKIQKQDQIHKRYGKYSVKRPNFGKSLLCMLFCRHWASQHVFSDAAHRAASNDYPFVYGYSGFRSFLAVLRRSAQLSGAILRYDISGKFRARTTSWLGATSWEGLFRPTSARFRAFSPVHGPFFTTS